MDAAAGTMARRGDHAMTDKRHNWGQKCTGQFDCNCNDCCLCYVCSFHRRSASLYRGMQSRMSEKKWKSGKRAGTTRVPKRPIPYSLDQFRAWLTCILEDTPSCDYCGQSINIMTISPDHAKPLKRGGSLELSNLRGCCHPCQNAKADLMPSEYKFLLKCIATLPEPARVSIMRRLRGGILHFGNSKQGPKATNILVIPPQKDDF